MLKIRLFERRFVAIVAILLLAAPSILTTVLQPARVGAAQLTNRKITIGTSVVSASDVTYFVSLDVATTNTIKGIVVQFCNSATGPLVGVACTTPTGFDLNLANLVVANQKINNVTVTNPYAINGSSTSNTLILTDATGNAATAGQSLTFDLGTAGVGDGVTNPSTTGTYYARILTYTSNVTAAAYTDTTPGTHIDDGGIALSTANQLTIRARLQEILQFCVGTTSIDDSTTPIAGDCSGTFTGNCGTTVDLGILDSSVISVSPVTTNPGTPGSGNACNGATMVRTNASNGVAITYFAEQDSGSGQLKVPGQTCSGSSNLDQCFNDSSTQGPFTAGTEAFGVTVAGVNWGGTTSYVCVYTPANTCKLEPSTNYLGAGSLGSESYGSTNGFAWKDDGTTAQLASSTGPVDDEALVLRFAGTPNLITPTGSYTVTSTYIATATF